MPTKICPICHHEFDGDCPVCPECECQIDGTKETKKMSLQEERVNL